MTGPAERTLNRRILALAVPALGALIAEPLFLLADSAIIGHLGTAALAGLAIAAGVLTTAVGMSIFLAYGATAAVARRVGAGDVRGAIEHGVDGMWLAVFIGCALAAVIAPAAGGLVTLLGGRGDVAIQATLYLRWSTIGLPAMLLVLACTGALRGLQRTVPPLVVAAVGAVLNAGLNVLLVYGLGMGIAGSALGTVIVQILMAVTLTGAVLRSARGERLRLVPSVHRIGSAGRAGFWVFVRTLSIRAAVLAAVAVGAAKGEVALAGLQITMNVWNLLALALDAIAIAAQALTGQALGAGDAATARALTRRMLGAGCWGGLALGVLLAAAAPFVGRLFTPDPAVIGAVTASCLVLAAGQLLSGWVFVLDGVLLGAGDGRYLAITGLLNLVCLAPALGLVLAFAGGGAVGLTWLWTAYIGGYMTSRAVTLGLRYRTDGWLVIGLR
jgi:putative MATE family efflux protein